MQRYWKPIFRLLTLPITLLAFYASQAQRPSEGATPTVIQPRRSDEVDATTFPTVDYWHEKQLKGPAKLRRDEKGKKYNSGHVPPISEISEVIFTFIDWGRGLPALPVDRSAAVVIGSISEAHAHLSQDETKIYSEFIVQVEAVLKNDESNSISSDAKITVERPGGRVRFPSGKVVTNFVSHQDLPQVGKQYVFFLTYDFILGGHYPEDFFILTAYELREGKVFPLDKLAHGHPIRSYAGQNAASFLRELSSAIQNVS